MADKRMSPRAVIELAAGHASSASQPGPVADLIEKAANELSGRRSGRLRPAAAQAVVDKPPDA
ncbi:hypothetical protein [Streptomyces sp. NBC_01361]|uniref:hypothetical protein n=1 Tax=Streptomyces sp. NBC_01361 TaxID=2903838 RepID=UPI002E341558|nr:hypothetical protein [Streptomyces sp. NBC_01361]